MPSNTPPTSPINSPVAAIRAMIGRLRPIPTETLSLDRAFGRIFAQDAATDRPSPAADISAMDGYAVRIADLARAELPIAGDLLIGREPIAIPPSTCLRIVTGAPIPPGAEAVVKREDVQERETSIAIPPGLVHRIRPDEHIRRRGDNGPSGTLFARAGDTITPALAGALATFGHADVLVHRPLRVAVISTGDEVLDIRDTPTPFQLRDGNGPSLCALFDSRPWIIIATHQRIGDDEQAITKALAAAVDSCDAVLLSGGVSMGHRDFVPEAIRRVGGEVIFHKLPQRPGKPMLGAVVGDAKVIFGLPGNPMSVLVTAARIAHPVLRHLAGGRATDTRLAVQLTNADTKTADLWWYRPVRLTEPGRAQYVPAQGSGDVIAIASSDGFVELPPNSSGPGPYSFYPWTGPL